MQWPEKSEETRGRGRGQSEDGRGGCTWSEHSPMHRLGESLCFIHLRLMSLCVNNTHTPNKVEMVVKASGALGLGNCEALQPWERGGMEGEKETAGGSREDGREEAGIGFNCEG